jgi:hypothetical protein
MSSTEIQGERRKPQEIAADTSLQIIKLALASENRIRPGTGTIEHTFDGKSFEDYRSTKFPDRVVRVITRDGMNASILVLDYETLRRLQEKGQPIDKAIRNELTVIRSDAFSLTNAVRPFVPPTGGSDRDPDSKMVLRLNLG